MRQIIHQLQRALHGGLGLQRVNIAKARQARHFFVEAWIMLHGARAKRIETRINGMVFLAEAHEMAHRFRLRQTRQVDVSSRRAIAKARSYLWHFVEVDAAILIRANFKNQRLF